MVSFKISSMTTHLPVLMKQFLMNFTAEHFRALLTQVNQTFPGLIFHLHKGYKFLISHLYHFYYKLSSILNQHNNRDTLPRTSLYLR